MSSERHVYEPPAALVEAAHVSGMAAYQALCDEATRDYEGSGHARPASCSRGARPFRKVLNADSPPFFQVVRRRHAQRFVQLPRPQRRGRPRREDGDRLRGRRRCGHDGRLQRAAREDLPARQRPEGPRPRQGRPRRHLHADVGRGRGRDAGLRTHRCHAFGGVRRLLGAEPARPNRRYRRGARHHRRRAVARRQGVAVEGNRRRSARAGPATRCATCSSTSEPAGR